MKSKEMDKTTTVCATETILQIISGKTTSNSSKTQDRRIVSSFKAFLNNANIDDVLSNMTLFTIERYQTDLLERNKKVKTINCYTATIIHLLKMISRYKEYEYNFSESGLADFQPISNKVSKNERKKKQIALTDEEVIQLYKYPLKGVEAEIRDVFVCQCLLGQRIGDMGRLFAHEYTVETINSVKVITFVQQKTKERAVIPLLPIAKNILEKYKNGFKHINFSTYRFDNNINRRIKAIGKKAGLKKEIRYSEQKGHLVVEKVDKQYNLLHTHTARHTFITIMCRLGVKKETIIIATGHADTKMIDDVYSHLNSEDNAKAIVEAFSGLQGKIFNMGKAEVEPTPVLKSTNDSTSPISFTLVVIPDFQKAKEVLAYLRISSTTVIEGIELETINTTLHQMIDQVKEKWKG